MKRFLTLLAVISMTLVAMAQHPMATLSHNGELTQFTGVHALQEAVTAAEYGDVIYLSEGEFLSNNAELWIDPRIKIVGCGYNSYIPSLVCIYMDAGAEYTWDGDRSPVLDGVRLKQLAYHPDTKRIEYSAIRNCWIEYFSNASLGGEEVQIDRCIIGALSNGGYGTVYLNNCKIGNAQDGFFNAIVTNCNLKGPDLPRIAVSSIFEARNDDLGFNTGGTHKVYNSLFQSENVLNYGNVTFQDCYFENPANGLLDENLNATIDLQAKGYLGQDGTVIGAYGGDNPFSEYPSVPSIDSDKSSVEFDPTTNKLNVTITVASN